uniref:Lipase n=1 Tax=Caenorhabditis tropicalis TaxID=1561998 RepID=A0A1I7UMV7_9PELO
MFFAFILVLVCIGQASTALTGPLSPNFQSWLTSNGYSSYDFTRSDYGTKGSYGGFTKTSIKASKTPVIFLHGNSDSALKTSSMATGWDNSIAYFETKGYTSAELYATSWQDNNPIKAGTRTHNCKDLTRLRKFFEAVLAYTGFSKVSVVSHSMGVTLGRKVINGGTVNATDGTCNLGNSISSNIDVFVGIAGANYGLCNCAGTIGSLSATCNKKNGFWPGDACGLYTSSYCGLSATPCNGLSTYSHFLNEMNTSNQKEASYLFSLWSKADDLIGNSDIVWGRPTSLIPLSDGKIIYDSFTHMQSKENTAADQYKLVTSKKV